LRRLLRRLAVPTGDSPISEILEWSDPAAAARWRDATSDAGRYLLGLAEWKGQIPDLLDHVVAVQSAIERSGVWEGYDEWRIGTASTHRIERQGVNYRVSTECGDVFAATVRSLPVALEARRVLFKLTKDLFWEVGWASWEGRRKKHEVREPYLARISREAVSRANVATIRPTSVDWLEGTAYEVVVEHGCLSMTCTSPTIERARQFAGIFEALEADIIRLLEWC